MRDYQLHVERIAMIPTTEANLTNPPAQNHIGYEVTYFLSGPNQDEQTRIVMTTQLQSLPAIHVKDLGPWLLGRLRTQIGTVYRAIGDRQHAMDSGAASLPNPEL